MSKRNFGDITALMDSVYEAERLALTKLIAREERLRSQLAELALAKSTPASSMDRKDDPALVAGADLQWHRWIDQRREVFNTELAQVLALQEAQKTKVKLAFGRQQVARDIARKEKMEAAKLLRRRGSYTS